MNIDFDQLKELLSIVSQNEISELTVESGEERITVKKPGNCPVPESASIPHMVVGTVTGHAGSLRGSVTAPAVEMHTAAQDFAAPASQMPVDTKENLLKIAAPMVGTFYRSPSPDKPVFVEVGDRISVGQTVCIIEAMKLMNDLPSEVSGRIVDIPVANGSTVEYGQVLFLVDPET